MSHKTIQEVSFTVLQRKITAMRIFFSNHLISWKDFKKWFFPTINQGTPYVCINCYNFLGSEYETALQVFNFTLLHVLSDHTLNHLTMEDSSAEENDLPRGYLKTHTTETTQLSFFFFFSKKNTHSIIIPLCSQFLQNSIISTNLNVQNPYFRVHKLKIIDRL